MRIAVAGELPWSRFPHYQRIFDQRGRQHCREDVKYHLLYLTDAVNTQSMELFTQYLRWVKRLFEARSDPPSILSGEPAGDL
ncbi:MAG TPA: hypothetical protein ENN41_04745 [Sediminispirochaeta sp.]|nr:hypothetical protein [Sediminispirochaeta sp.]